jgi:TonB family protein
MKEAFLSAVIVLGSTGGTLAQAPAQSSGQEITRVVQPRVLKEVKPAYPADALTAGIVGAVELECIVKADGTVSDIKVVKPLEPSLDEAAVAALKQWQFAPGTKDGTPIDVQVTIEMSFTTRPRGPKLDSSEVYKVGGDVVAPRVMKEVKPLYPADVMRARVSGEVALDCVVLPDGTVGDARVVRSVHPELDTEALKAIRQWRFAPGTKDGKAVPVQVTITMTFTFK